MSAGHVYSQAPRCSGCAERALLTKEAAHALLTESNGRLTTYRCPTEPGGWHVVPTTPEPPP